MFLRKRERNRSNKIINDSKIYVENDNSVSINIKAESEDKIFSSFNYENKESLTQELSEHIWDSVKIMPFKKDVRLNFYTKENLSKDEVRSAIRYHYGREYVDVKDQIRKTNRTALTCLLLGIFSLGLLVLFHLIFDFFLVVTITEIMAWAFVWEAIDLFFFRRAELRRKALRIQKIYFAEINIIKDKTEKEPIL